VKITLLPSDLREGCSLQCLTSFLIEDAVAIDAGCLGFFRSMKPICVMSIRAMMRARTSVAVDTFANSDQGRHVFSVTLAAVGVDPEGRLIEEHGSNLVAPRRSFLVAPPFS
jgi:hypothetical protein